MRHITPLALQRYVWVVDLSVGHGLRAAMERRVQQFATGMFVTLYCVACTCSHRGFLSHLIFLREAFIKRG